MYYPKKDYQTLTIIIVSLHNNNPNKLIRGLEFN